MILCVPTLKHVANRCATASGNRVFVGGAAKHCLPPPIFEKLAGEQCCARRNPTLAAGKQWHTTLALHNLTPLPLA